VPRRILTLSWEYPPVVEGGLARAVHKLSEALARGGDHVDVLTRGLSAVGRDGPVSEQRGGVRVHRAAEPPKPADLTRFLRWIGRMNRDMVARGADLPRPDVVHGHDWLVGRAAARLADHHGVPLVVTIHATEHGRHQGWVHRRPQRTIHEAERAMARRADRVVVCSRFMADHVREVFGVEAEVIPNGLDPEDLAPTGDLPALRARFAAPGERLVLLAGRLMYEKGFQDALDALAAVARRVDGVRFVVAGTGTHEDELRRQAAALGIDGRGTFLGWAGDEVLHGLYRVADVCVVPSRYEPFGLVPLEAMASGCPVIASDVGGLREVVPNDLVGLRFAAADAVALARMLEWSLTNPALRFRMREEALAHVARFDWDDVARRTRAVHDGVCGPPGGHEAWARVSR
jgi:glycogen synthase